ncbi:MAG: type IX secretion system membrane protein PorP/SprF [Paludibacteraceae bacterium]|nr:type IX secretion system membrane protein PorP/SprF [Paludibacteraceae bacterium]MBN2786776.1 type IX secretion system membrane protein PorP/SprF [Paludibacteraceae bacterium]
MRRTAFFLLFVIVCLYTNAQNYKQYNHYIANQGLLNPAYNGTRDYLSGLVVVRNQWIGIEGAPVTQALNIHSPISTSNLGLGLSVTNENIGATHTLDLYAAVSYKVELTEDYLLSFGIQGGINSFSLDQSEIITGDNSDPVLYGSSNSAMNAGFGSYLYSDKLFVGLSIPEFFTNEYNTTASEYIKTFDYKNIHYYLYGGYVFEFTDLAFKPTILTRFVYGAPIQIDLSGNFLVFEKAWLGLSYKTSSELVFLVEYVINNMFSVRYSYDYPFSSLNQVKNAGSHELGIQFDLNFGKTVMKSIRYF